MSIFHSGVVRLIESPPPTEKEVSRDSLSTSPERSTSNTHRFQGSSICSAAASAPDSPSSYEIRRPLPAGVSAA